MSQEQSVSLAIPDMSHTHRPYVDSPRPPAHVRSEQTDHSPRVEYQTQRELGSSPDKYDSMSPEADSDPSHVNNTGNLASPSLPTPPLQGSLLHEGHHQPTLQAVTPTSGRSSGRLASPQGVCHLVSETLGQVVNYATTSALTPQTGYALASAVGAVAGNIASKQMNDRVCSKFSPTHSLQARSVSPLEVPPSPRAPMAINEIEPASPLVSLGYPFKSSIPEEDRQYLVRGRRPRISPRPFTWDYDTRSYVPRVRTESEDYPHHHTPAKSSDWGEAPTPEPSAPPSPPGYVWHTLEEENQDLHKIHLVQKQDTVSLQYQLYKAQQEIKALQQARERDLRHYESLVQWKGSHDKEPFAVRTHPLPTLLTSANPMGYQGVDQPPSPKNSIPDLLGIQPPLAMTASGLLKGGIEALQAGANQLNVALHQTIGHATGLLQTHSSSEQHPVVHRVPSVTSCPAILSPLLTPTTTPTPSMAINRTTRQPSTKPTSPPVLGRAIATNPTGITMRSVEVPATTIIGPTTATNPIHAQTGKTIVKSNTPHPTSTVPPLKIEVFPGIQHTSIPNSLVPKSEVSRLSFAYTQPEHRPNPSLNALMTAQSICHAHEANNRHIPNYQKSIIFNTSRYCDSWVASCPDLTPRTNASRTPLLPKSSIPQTHTRPQPHRQPKDRTLDMDSRYAVNPVHATHEGKSMVLSTPKEEVHDRESRHPNVRGTMYVKKEEDDGTYGHERRMNYESIHSERSSSHKSSTQPRSLPSKQHSYPSHHTTQRHGPSQTKREGNGEPPSPPSSHSSDSQPPSKGSDKPDKQGGRDRSNQPPSNRGPPSPISIPQIPVDSTGMADFARAILNLTQAIAKPSDPKPIPFRMNYNMTIKHVVFAKDQRMTPAIALKCFGWARDVDIQAHKAACRTPTTKAEWAMFFKLHLAHFQDSLHEQMCSLVHQQLFTSTDAFWMAVWKILFPACSSRDIISKAFSTYMVWDEHLGLERWQAISTNLLTYQAFMAGKTGPSQDRYVAEHMYQHMLRVVDNCLDMPTALLSRDVLTFTDPVEVAMAAGDRVSTTMYQQAFAGFSAFLQRRLSKHTYQVTFGRNKASNGIPSKPVKDAAMFMLHGPTSTSSTSPIPTPRVQPTTDTHTPLSFQQVVVEGGVGHQGQNLRAFANSAGYYKPVCTRTT